MKMLITIEVDGPMSLANAEELVRKSMRGFKKDRVLDENDNATKLIPYTPINPAAKVRWEMFE